MKFKEFSKDDFFSSRAMWYGGSELSFRMKTIVEQVAGLLVTCWTALGNTYDLLRLQRANYFTGKDEKNTLLPTSADKLHLDKIKASAWPKGSVWEVAGMVLSMVSVDVIIPVTNGSMDIRYLSILFTYWSL